MIFCYVMLQGKGPEGSVAFLGTLRISINVHLPSRLKMELAAVMPQMIRPQVRPPGDAGPRE